MTYIIKEGVIGFVLTKTGLEYLDFENKTECQPIGTISAIYLSRDEFNQYIHDVFRRKEKEITFDLDNIVEAMILEQFSDDTPYHATLVQCK